MAYVNRNFQTKKAFKEAVKEGREVYVQPNAWGYSPDSETVCIEGPWYPQPHKWYATVKVDENARVVSIK